MSQQIVPSYIMPRVQQYQSPMKKTYLQHFDEKSLDSENASLQEGN